MHSDNLETRTGKFAFTKINVHMPSNPTGKTSLVNLVQIQFGAVTTPINAKMETIIKGRVQ